MSLKRVCRRWAIRSVSSLLASLEKPALRRASSRRIRSMTSKCCLPSQRWPPSLLPKCRSRPRYDQILRLPSSIWEPIPSGPTKKHWASTMWPRLIRSIGQAKLSNRPSWSLFRQMLLRQTMRRMLPKDSLRMIRRPTSWSGVKPRWLRSICLRSCCPAPWSIQLLTSRL